MRAADKHGEGAKRFITGYSKPGSGLTALYHDLLYCLNFVFKDEDIEISGSNFVDAGVCFLTEDVLLPSTLIFYQG